MKRLYNHYFPTPSYLTMNPCAIDISEQTIKYGQLEATSSGLHLGKYGKENIPSGVVVSGRIEKEDELINILKKIKEKENLHFIRVSLPEEQMYLFTLSLPKTDDDENIRDMILLQIEEHIPLKAPDSIFDYDIISTNEQNILIEVIAMAEVTLSSYLSVFERAGLVPVSFELEAQAIARAVIAVEDTAPVMIVDFGNTKTGISICNNGRVFLTTTLSIGGVDLTNMISKNFSLSFEEAEKMKHEYGIDKVSKAEDIFPAILNGLSVLRDELNKQYVYWETHNNSKNDQINHIILCGGDANLAGLSEYLELSMKIKVENANVWINILDTDKVVPDMSFEDSLSYATVLGLALGGYIYKSKSVINILPEKEKTKLVRGYWMRYLTILLNLISLMGIIASLLLFPSYFFSKLKEDMFENNLEIFNKDNPELENVNLDQIIKEVNSKLEILNKNKEPYKISDKVFDNILSSRTQGITFSQIIFSKKIVKKEEATILEIYGKAKDRDSLRIFKETLDGNPNFSEVDLPISNFLGKSDLIFTISITLKK